jgi:hypothetical protein
MGKGDKKALDNTFPTQNLNFSDTLNIPVCSLYKLHFVSNSSAAINLLALRGIGLINSETHSQ